MPEPTDAVSGLLHDHELVVRMLRKVVDDAEQAKDRATGDLLTDLMRDHEKMAWMLRAFLEGEALSPRVDTRTSIPDFA